MATQQPTHDQPERHTPGGGTLMSLVAQDSRYEIDLKSLPRRANIQAIARYLLTLSETGADASIILYTDQDGPKKIASYDKRSKGHAEEVIHIQSTTKALFTLYLVHLLGDRLWANMDTPIDTLLPKGTLRAMSVASEWDKSLDNKGFEERWEKLNLRQLLNHASGIPSNEKLLIKGGSVETPGQFTRYSNLAVEVASIVAQQWMRKETGNPFFKLYESANSFLGRNFVSLFTNRDATSQPPMTFSLYENPSTDFSHLIASGKARGTVSQVAALPIVVRGLGQRNIELLVKPIKEHDTDLKSGIGAYPELSGPENSTYWGGDLNPEVIANLFYLRRYGYATRGSFENNCDVIIQDYSGVAKAEERARWILNNPYFTVVRLQKEPSTFAPVAPPPHHGLELQSLLETFFLS